MRMIRYNPELAAGKKPEEVSRPMTSDQAIVDAATAGEGEYRLIGDKGYWAVIIVAGNVLTMTLSVSTVASGVAANARRATMREAP